MYVSSSCADNHTGLRCHNIDKKNGTVGEDRRDNRKRKRMNATREEEFTLQRGVDPTGTRSVSSNSLPHRLRSILQEARRAFRAALLEFEAMRNHMLLGSPYSAPNGDINVSHKDAADSSSVLAHAISPSSVLPSPYFKVAGQRSVDSVLQGIREELCSIQHLHRFLSAPAHNREGEVAANYTVQDNTLAQAQEESSHAIADLKTKLSNTTVTQHNGKSISKSFLRISISSASDGNDDSAADLCTGDHSRSPRQNIILPEKSSHSASDDGDAKTPDLVDEALSYVSLQNVSYRSIEISSVLLKYKMNRQLHIRSFQVKRSLSSAISPPAPTASYSSGSSSVPSSISLASSAPPLPSVFSWFPAIFAPPSSSYSLLPWLLPTHSQPEYVSVEGNKESAGSEPKSKSNTLQLPKRKSEKKKGNESTPVMILSLPQSSHVDVVCRFRWSPSSSVI